MLTDNIVDIRRYTIMFPKPRTDSFLMCKGWAEFITRYPREYEGAPFDELRLGFEGFRGKIGDQVRFIDGVRVYLPFPVLVVINRLVGDNSTRIYCQVIRKLIEERL